MLISDAFKAYASDVIVFRNQSRKTEEHHYTALNNLIKFLGSDFDVSELTFDHIRNWKISMEKRNLTSITIRGYLIKLRVVLAYLTKQGIPCLNPEQIPLPKHQAQVPEFITPQEVDRLIKAMNKPCAGYPEVTRIRNTAIISLLYGSGIRVGELCALDRDSINEDSFTVIGKGNKPRLCFIDTRTKELMRQYLNLRKDNHVALFLANQTKQRVTPGNIQDMMCRGWKKAGFSKPIHPHTLRHSFATNLMRNGMHIYPLSRLLGHSSILTTQVYLHISDLHLQQEYKKYHTVE